eukprot:g2712.t1
MFAKDLGERYRDPPHTDGQAFATVVIALNSAGRDYEGGLYVVSDPWRPLTVSLAGGDAVIHRWDLQHGVEVTSGRRLSWILWLQDQAPCVTQVELHQRSFLQSAAEDGNVVAMQILGTGENGRSEEGQRWLRMAAEAGLSGAMAQLAKHLREQGQEAEALQWLQHAAGRGDAGAQSSLGMMLLQRGQLKEAEECEWLEEAAELGNPVAQHDLGMALYTNALGRIGSESSSMEKRKGYKTTPMLALSVVKANGDLVGTFHEPPDSLVLQLQQSIHARGGPAPPFQRLLCGPRELGATESLSSLREEDTTLQLLVVVPEGRPCDVRWLEVQHTDQLLEELQVEYVEEGRTGGQAPFGVPLDKDHVLRSAVELQVVESARGYPMPSMGVAVAMVREDGYGPDCRMSLVVFEAVPQFLSETRYGLDSQAGTMLRTTKETPEVPQVLAVMLLRSTYDSVESWGIYPSMAEYQKQFAIQLRDGFEGFRGRYENYDLTELYNTSKLLQSRSGGVTNRFYFSFLNDAQWRVIGRAIRRASDREQFAQLVGSRLYQSILRGEELKSDVDGQQDESLPSIGYWPSLQVPKGSDPASLSAGCKQILKYLKDVGYCRDFQIGDFKTSEGLMEFISFVLDPVNLDATVSLMRSNNNFAPRYEQRILQAYFADSGFSSTFEDTLAENITGETTSRFGRSAVRRRAPMIWPMLTQDKVLVAAHEVNVRPTYYNEESRDVWDGNNRWLRETWLWDADPRGRPPEAKELRMDSMGQLRLPRMNSGSLSQCTNVATSEHRLCTSHEKQLTGKGLAHGFVTGPIPASKLQEFEVFALQLARSTERSTFAQPAPRSRADLPGKRCLVDVEISGREDEISKSKRLRYLRMTLGWAQEFSAK